MDNVLEFQVIANNKVQPVLQQASAAVGNFSAQIASLKTPLDTIAAAQDKLIDGINRLVEAHKKGAESAKEHGEKMKGAAHEAGELGHALESAEHNAEMRELSLSIREGIENPLMAAKSAAEGFLLTIGEAGLAGTALVAASGALFETAEHVAELSHEYEKLGIELGIDADKAQLLSRALELESIQPTTLLMASRTLSKTLEENTEQSQKVRKDLAALGVQMRDVTTGAFLPFDQLLPSVLKHLSDMPDITARNRLAVELLGRSGLLLLPLGKNFQALQEQVHQSSAYMTDDQIQLGSIWERTWKGMKLDMEGVIDTIGTAMVATSLPRQALSEGEHKPLVEPAKGKEEASTYGKEFGKELGIQLSGIQKIVDDNRTKTRLGADDKQLKEIQENNALVKRSLDSIGDSATALEEKLKINESTLKDLKDKLSGMMDVSPEASKPLREQVATQNSIVNSIKAQIAANKELIAGQEKLVEMRKADLLASVSASKVAEEIVKARIDVVSAPASLQGQTAQLGQQRIAIAAQKELEKAAKETVKGIEESLKRELEVQDKFFKEKITKDDEALKLEIQNNEDRLKAAYVYQIGDLELREQGLKTAEKVELDKAKAMGESVTKQQKIRAAYNEEIKKTIDAITALKVAEENVSLKPGETGAAKTADITEKGEKEKKGIDDSDVIANAKKTAQEIAEIFKGTFAKLNDQIGAAFSKMITSGESFSKAFRNIPREMLADWVSALSKMLMEHAEHFLMMEVIEKAWQSTSLAVHAAYVAIKKTLDDSVRISSAKTAAANTYASVSAIPIVGPFLAPPAAAAAFVGALAFEQGGIMPNAESLALLHPREMVLPAPISQTIQNMAAASAGGGGFNSGNSGGHTFNIHYHGYQGQNQESMRTDANTIKKHIRTLSRENRL